MKIQHRISVVSGASSGIGAATAVALAKAGAAHVVLLGRREAALAKVQKQVEFAGAKGHAYVVDLANTDATWAVAARIRAEVGEPDILVNNAGAGRWLFPEETEVDEAAAMMAVPYLATFTLTRAFLPAMLERHSGHVVNVTSPAAYLPWPGATAYSAARWAMRGFSEALMADVRGTGVDVTLMVPGKVSSGYFETNPGSEARIPKISRVYRTLRSEQVAAEIVRAIARRRRVVIRPRLLACTIIAARLFPGVVPPLMYWTGARRQ